MKPRLLVVTTVHHPDDNRIREKTVRSLEPVFEISYAARAPGPSDRSGLAWLPLRGSRLRRNFAAWLIAFRGRFDLVSMHDPELLPLGLALSFARRNVVFDVHEDVPAQISTKQWLPSRLRRPTAWVVRGLLRFAERRMTLTLAESSYGRILRGDHPVISNYPDTADLPRNAGEGAGAVYVGDVSEARGIIDAVVACGAVDLQLTLVGPCSDSVRSVVESARLRHGADVVLTGRLPHHEAMMHVAKAAVALSPLRDIPNYRNSIPTKVLEYLAVGVPVVASDLPATREVVAGLEAVELHRPGDADDLAAAIRRLLDPGQAAKARAQSDRVRESFRWPADKLRSIYEDARA